MKILLFGLGNIIWTDNPYIIAWLLITIPFIKLVINLQLEIPTSEYDISAVPSA